MYGALTRRRGFPESNKSYNDRLLSPSPKVLEFERLYIEVLLIGLDKAPIDEMRVDGRWWVVAA